MTSTAPLHRPTVTDITLPGEAPAVVLSAGVLRTHLEAAQQASAMRMLNRRVAGQGAKVPDAVRRTPLVVQLPTSASAAVSGRFVHRRAQAPITV